MVSRYAIYYAPAPDSRWWHFGSRWLGRDAACGRTRAQFQVPGIRAEDMRSLTEEPRRYGFHATLKPPFALAEGASPEDLYQSVETLVASRQPFALGRLTLQRLGGFLALMPEDEPLELATLAADCVEQLDLFRAPASPAELARRRQTGLSRRQEELLSRWGYPHVLDHWRFHMTLTGPVEGVKRQVLSAWLDTRLRELCHEYLVVDALCVFEQAAPQAPFRLARRFDFQDAPAQGGAGGDHGRLFYVVGASGSGKDSLLAFARERLASEQIVFVRRYITREQQESGECHRPVSAEEFDALSGQGAFAMQWDSHGCRYGIGTEIDRWLARGRDVVVNGSREYLGEARQRYPGLKLIWIEASVPNLRSRLAARGREDEAAMEQRLQRATRYAPPQDAILIANDGHLHEAGLRLLEVLAPVESALPR